MASRWGDGVDDTEKKKKGLPESRTVWRGYLALGVAVGVSLWFGFSIRGIGDFPRPQQTPMLYPFVLLLRQQGACLGIPALLMLGLFVAMGFASAQRVHWAIAGLAIPPSLCAYLWIMGALFFSPQLLHEQTLSDKDHVYHLVTTYLNIDTDVGRGGYIVLECERLGLICRYYSMPYILDGWYLGDKDAMNERAMLFVDEADQSLKLRVADQVYSMDKDLFVEWANAMCSDYPSMCDAEEEAYRQVVIP